ncbi:MAG: hypothetical protein NC318_11710 [Blautia sp.]|nr:hypothetical protein [Lachnoclostridium sp.]MCM1212260.1 hypothetical protein [Blautia sp.]
MAENRKSDFNTYDYLKVTVLEDKTSVYMDGYENFGWKLDENMPPVRNMGKVTLHFKRSRQIVNKVELTRLQRHFESCMSEITALEESVQSTAAIVSISCGLSGCVFMACSVFAVTALPPRVVLCAVLAVPGFFLWFMSWHGYRIAKARRKKKVVPLVETKYDEVDEVLEKAQKLL